MLSHIRWPPVSLNDVSSGVSLEVTLTGNQMKHTVDLNKTIEFSCLQQFWNSSAQQNV